MKQTVKEIDIKGKTVLLRTDFNVPIKNGKIQDDKKIREALETINYIISKKAKLIIISHLGKIKTEEDKEKNSLKPISIYLEKIINKKVLFDDFEDIEKLKDKIKELSDSEIILLENTRFDDVPNKLESNCNIQLVNTYASLADIFITDAFGTIHRKHASNSIIAEKLPSAIGFLIEKEIKNLSILDKPKRPFIIIMGGSKVSSKIKLIKSLLPKADKILLGGALSFTFLKAKGIEIKSEYIEDDYIKECKQILKKYKGKIILPNDFIDYKDIGDLTIENFKKELKDTKTVFMNGPLGIYEQEKYQKGTNEILTYIKDKVPITIIGGGDIALCVKKLGYEDYLTYL